MYKSLAVFLTSVFLYFSVCADTITMLPQSSLASSDCVGTQYSCPGFPSSASQNCSSNSLDSDSCSVFNSDLNTIKIVELGNVDTEGAYVQCLNENDYDSCRKNGNFSVVGDYNSASPNPLRVAHNSGSGAEIKGPNGVIYYCPMTRCDVRTEGINFVYEFGGESYNMELYVTSPPFASSNPAITYSVKQVGNSLCVYAISDAGVLDIGCKNYESLYVPTSSSKESCFQNTACASDAQSHSKVFWSVSSKVVECVRDVLDLVFLNDAKCKNQNFLPGLQQYLRQTVFVALILYIILFGIKLVTNSQLISKGEFFMLFFKIAMVLYFSVGMRLDNGKFESGLSDFVYPAGLAAMTSFSNIIMDGSSSNGLCRYNSSDYEDGYEYLALWDSLDCRVAYYLGLYLIKDSPGSGGNFQSGIYGILGTIIPAFLSLEIVFIILMIIYGIFILSIAVYFVHFYVIAMVAFAITVYLGVIIVPMVLFSYTKQFFDAWIKILFSYVLQPVIITAFMAFLLLVFDGVVYGNCEFKHSTVFGKYDSWTIDGSACTDQNDPRCSGSVCKDQNGNACDASCVDQNGNQCTSSVSEECKKSIGYIFLRVLDQEFLTIQSAIFFEYTIVSSQFSTLISLDFIGKMLKVLLFIYLLSLFARDLGSFAAELTSGTNIGQLATDPNALFKKLMKMATSSKKKSKSNPSQRPKGSSKGISAAGKKRKGINVSG